MTLVTVSAAYGAGGSRVAPALAERLGVPFLARPPSRGARQRAGGRRLRRGRLGRGGQPLSRWVSIAVSWGTPPGMTAEELLPGEARRRELEAELLAFAEGGAGVILGRAAVAVLRDDPRALHVLLDGPVEARIAPGDGRSRASTARPRGAGATASTASGGPTWRTCTGSRCASRASSTSRSTRPRWRSTTAWS